MKIYVIAGNHNQAYEYINRKLEERISNGEMVSKIGDYVYVDSINRIKGISNPHGVFIGTWKDRPDIIDIVETLMIQSTSPNSSLGKILKQLKHKKHDKINPYQHAADLLAKEIDSEVLRQLNGGDLINRQTKFQEAFNRIFKENITND